MSHSLDHDIIFPLNTIRVIFNSPNGTNSRRDEKGLPFSRIAFLLLCANNEATKKKKKKKKKNGNLRGAQAARAKNGLPRRKLWSIKLMAACAVIIEHERGGRERRPSAAGLVWTLVDGVRMSLVASAFRIKHYILMTKILMYFC